MDREEYEEWFRQELFSQIADSERFQQFIRMNYDIHQVIDEEMESARLQVIEVPYEVAQERIKAEVKEKLEGADESIVLAGADMLGKLDKIKKP